MKKHILITMLLCLCLLFAACGNNSTGGSDKANTYDPEVLTAAYDAVKAAYGERYLPAMLETDPAYATGMMGIEEDLFTEFFVDMPLISAHVDNFIGFLAAEGKAADLKAAVENYRDIQADDRFAYPNNVPKLQNAVVYANGNYVFYFILGGYNDELTDDEAIVKYYQEQGQVGINALDTFFAE